MNMRKHIKTFESFYHEDDMTREIAGFMDCSMEKMEFGPEYDDTSMFLVYTLEGDIDLEALSALTEYLMEEKGIWATAVDIRRKEWLDEPEVIKNLILTEVPLKDAIRKWAAPNTKEAKDYLASWKFLHDKLGLDSDYIPF